MVWRVAPKKASRPVAWLIVAFILYVCMLCRFIATRTKIAILPRAVTDARVRRPRALGFRRLRCQTRVDPPETAPSSMRNDGSGELPPSCGRTPKKSARTFPPVTKKAKQCSPRAEASHRVAPLQRHGPSVNCRYAAVRILVCKRTKYSVYTARSYVRGCHTSTASARTLGVIFFFISAPFYLLPYAVCSKPSW